MTQTRSPLSALLVLTAFLETATGLGLITVPSFLASVLLGAPLELPAGVVVARIAGAALLSLSLVCWLARNDQQGPLTRGLVKALVLYNIAAVAVLVYAHVGLGLSGIGLWPTVVLHTALAVLCIVCLQRRT